MARHIPPAGDAFTCALSDALPMRGQTLTQRRFWWDRTTEVDVRPLRAVIFDLDALGEADSDGHLVSRSGLIDLVMSLFVAGIWVGVVSDGRRAQVDALVRELIGDGLVETIVTADDADSTDLYESALWEFGIEPESALAVVDSSGLGAAGDAGLAAVVVSGGYDDLDSGAACERVHRREWTAHKQAAA